MSDDKKNTQRQSNVTICKDSALPPTTSNSKMPPVKPVAQPTKNTTKDKE